MSAENYGVITGTGENVRGIYADDYSIVRNYGIINLTGDGSVGILGRGGSQIYNEAGSVINISGNNVYGIYLSGADTKLVNKGTINISGTGLGIAYTSTADSANITDITGTTQGMISQSYDLPEMPTLVNTGEIYVDVNGNFNYDGFKVIVTIDPATNTATTNSTTQVGFGGVVPNSFEVAPDFAKGTAADRYTFVNIFKGLSGKGEYISQSLTWDATAQGNDLVMTRKSYETFTDGLWYEDFGKALNEKYAVSTGDGREIFDRINYITNESDFRNIMSSLAGDVYANMNQRENDIADTFADSMRLLQDSKNNTKENVKINVIAGKGKNKEETDGVTGYDYETTGVLALREVERTYRHTFGYSLGYLHTGFEFSDSKKNEEDVDTIQIGMHNKYKANDWILRNDLTGRASIHDMKRSVDWVSPYGSSDITGKYESYSITSDNTFGKEMSLGKRMTLTPYGGIKAMYVTRPTFTEKGLEKLQIEGNDAWSVKPKAGVELKGVLPLGDADKWKLKGSLNVLYEYELADLNVREEARLTAIEDNYHKLAKPEDENGQLKTQISAGVEIEDRFGIFVTGEYKISESSKNDYRAG
ncbi:autotransporter outer membrane beta-barrel domain-containing protein, partial [Sebaldella sp. S0638]|uniref:autotransporter family protein n=1 Tax=Sebaldella sp. S0638 TaxID=2957809 RepID=UPI00209EB304